MKNFRLVEASQDIPNDKLCENCALMDWCDRIADDLNEIEYMLCATEEDWDKYERPIYIKDETNSDR